MSDMQRSVDSPSLAAVPPEISGAPKIATLTGSKGEIISYGTPQLNEAHSSFVEFHQGYISSYVQLADTKAAWVFAIVAGLLVYIVDKEDVHTLLVQPHRSLHLFVVATIVILFSSSAILSFLVVLPRLPASGESVVSFLSVAKKPSADSYVREIASMTEAVLIEARLRHSYTIAGVCARKYARLRLAFVTGMLGLAGMVLMMLMS